MNGMVRQQAIDQHAEVRQALLASGWGEVKSHPVVIGNAGTFTATADDALQVLGVDTADRMTLLRQLAVDSVRRTVSLLSLGAAS